MSDHQHRTHSSPAHHDELTPRRPVWRRSTGAPPPAAAADSTWSEQQPLRCGAEDLSVPVRYLQPGDLWEPERKPAAQSEDQPEPELERKPDRADDEDELKATAHFRNDRYAVKLLREDTAWGPSPHNDPGVLG